MPSLFANVPEGIVWGRVTAYVTAFVADGGTESPDGTPDAVPLEGTITLTPTVGVMVFPTLTPPQQAVIQSLECPIIGGVLYAPGTTPENVADRDPGVVLVASEQPLGLPDRVQYKVTWQLHGARVNPSPMTIDVPSQATVDLATVIPATPGPGVVVVVSTEDRERAEAAAAAAAVDAATASAKATAAAASATAAKTSETKAEASKVGAEAAAASISWAGLPGKPAVIAAGATAADARTAIDAVALTLDVAVPILESGVTLLAPRLVKQGKLVVCNLLFTAVAVGTGYIKQLTIPEGFRPRNKLGVTSCNGKRILLEPNGDLYMLAPVQTNDDRIAVTWETL